MNESNYADIFNALCRIPSMKDSTLSELAKLAKRLDGEGCFVDHEGDVIDANGSVFWPENDGTDGDMIDGDEPFIV